MGRVQLFMRDHIGRYTHCGLPFRRDPLNDMSAEGCDLHFEPEFREFWQDFPEIPSCEGGVLEGFEEFMEMTPRASAESFAAHGFAQPAFDTGGLLSAEFDEVEVAPVPTARRTPAERKQFMNRMSQARFRRKKKVRMPGHKSELSCEMVLKKHCSTGTHRNTGARASQNLSSTQ